MSATVSRSIRARTPISNGPNRRTPQIEVQVVPISYRAPSASAERFYNTLLDHTRKVMQLSAIATVLLYGYVLYGLLGGGIDQWANASHNDRVRILGNIESSILYLTIALGILLVSLTILYYDEEAIGYILVATSVFFYYGIPYALD